MNNDTAQKDSIAKPATKIVMYGSGYIRVSADTPKSHKPIFKKGDKNRNDITDKNCI